MEIKHRQTPWEVHFKDMQLLHPRLLTQYYRKKAWRVFCNNMTTSLSCGQCEYQPKISAEVITAITNTASLYQNAPRNRNFNFIRNKWEIVIFPTPFFIEEGFLQTTLLNNGVRLVNTGFTIDHKGQMVLGGSQKHLLDQTTRKAANQSNEKVQGDKTIQDIYHSFGLTIEALSVFTTIMNISQFCSESNILIPYPAYQHSIFLLLFEAQQLNPHIKDNELIAFCQKIDIPQWEKKLKQLSDYQKYQLEIARLLKYASFENMFAQIGLDLKTCERTQQFGAWFYRLPMSRVVWMLEHVFTDDADYPDRRELRGLLHALRYSEDT
jgi:hypothetical protein